MNDCRYYTKEEWDKVDKPGCPTNNPLHTRRCKDCLPRSCQRCNAFKCKQDFRVDEWVKKDAHRTCRQCEIRRCMVCYKQKQRTAFSEEMWQLPNDGTTIACKACARKTTVVGMWTCWAATCKKKNTKGHVRTCSEKIHHTTTHENKVSHMRHVLARARR